ncbi:pentapeptide repeat-containing protein [Scytonema hofmannii FACHB-248]|uniref:Pentapeptide repeat-containing protein n=1 Tax=Scytonema hofmannii FACHB-248 TaxID=1842502 RepID=A0ABR8GXK2_9CYAN|nr:MULTISPECIES: pentapeptide repeat-containing protein [Nostocales]MBD2607854.1 pentapeptide repeat-containing protein [Scytonema hofmannii FACHB-248]
MPPDYSGQNLRGRSFKGQNLTGANFSKADIRGANFTSAILKDADFTGAKAGLQKRWVIGLLIVSWLLSGLSGVSLIVFSIPVPFQAFIFETNVKRVIVVLVWLIVLPLLFFVTIHKKGLIARLGTPVFAAVVAVTAAYIVNVVGVSITAFKFIGVLTLVFAGAFIFTFAFALTGAVAVAVAGTLAGLMTEVIAVVFAVAFINTIVVIFDYAFTEVFVRAFALTFVGVLTLLGTYIRWCSLAGDQQDAWIRSFAIAFAATGGTSFRGANLINANFTGAILKNTDFRKANLIRTRFYEAKKLEFSRVGNTILTNRDVLNLLVTCNGKNKSYAGANLRGANLKGADLKEANFKGADIIVATFERACLEWANLTLTQAVTTDFTSAQMTGACVEAWNIDSTTKLDNVDCRFVYLLEYPKLGIDDRECRPSSGDFQPGEFTKLFEEVLNTVDLIFRNGIDWKAFVTAFNKVQAENEDTELALQSIENKGDGVVVVKVGVPDGADKEKIHSDFTNNYQIALQAVEEKYKAVLQAKDDEILFHRQQSAKIPEMIISLANKPINVQVENKLENQNMTNSNDASRKINIGSVGGDFNASGQALNLGEISGTVTNTINELPKSDEPEKPGIKELLTQLQTAIEADTNLSEEDKAEALEQVKALAEAGKNPQEGAMQKSAKTAMKILKGTISGLPSAATLVEACGKLLPLISGFLGLG